MGLRNTNKPRSPQPAKGGHHEVRYLWGNGFPLAKKGLDVDYVVAYVDELNRRYEAAMEELQVAYPSELATKAILEAEALGDSIKQERLREAAEQASGIILQAEDSAKLIVEEAEAEANQKLTEVRRLSAELVNEAIEKMALAAQEAHKLVPVQAVKLQADLRTVISRAYGQIGQELQSLEGRIRVAEVEHDIQHRMSSEEDALKAEAPTAKEHKGKPARSPKFSQGCRHPQSFS